MSDRENELLFRQIHPSHFLEDGAMSSIAFKPGGGDAGHLSTRQQFIGAERAYREWTKSHDSEGTWAVSVGEVVSLGLGAIDDSDKPEMPEGHASIVFDGLANKPVAQKARKLRDAATNRGRLHPEQS